MGWFDSDAPGHEGYLIALEVDPDAPPPYTLREIRYPDKRTVAVTYFKIGCECGWRSRLYRCPFGITMEWFPYCVFVKGDFWPQAGEELEDEAARIWHEHAKAEAIDRHWKHLRPGTDPR